MKKTLVYEPIFIKYCKYFNEFYKNSSDVSVG